MPKKLPVLLLPGSTGECMRAFLEIFNSNRAENKLLDVDGSPLRPICFRIQTKVKPYGANLNSGEILLCLPDHFDDLMQMPAPVTQINSDTFKVMTLMPVGFSIVDFLRYLDAIQSDCLSNIMPFQESKEQIIRMLNHCLTHTPSTLTKQDIIQWLNESKKALRFLPTSIHSIIHEYFSIQDPLNQDLTSGSFKAAI